MGDIQLVKGAERLTITGDVTFTVYWRAEAAANQGRVAKFARKIKGSDQIDLDAATLFANRAKKFVAAVHKEDVNVLNGAGIYGGDTVAQEGQAAFEFVTLNLSTVHPSVESIVLAATCFSSATGLARLAEFGFRITDAHNPNKVFLDELRSIEEDATAALFARLTRVGNGWAVYETDDTLVLGVTAGHQRWRALIDAAHVVLR